MITVSNLTYFYPGRKEPAVNDISFEVKKGEIFGFLGPSGAGKSTTQKILNGILKGFEGEVIVNGTNLRDLSPSFYEEIGVGFELPNLYGKLTALENLELFSSMYKNPAADLHELLSLLGLEKDQHTRVEAFSKGMKMRLNFLRALINRPRVVFLDEPTSGLDPINARKMKDVILNLKKQGTTIFLTTHNMSDAGELCDRLAFMIDGQLPVVDNPQNLKLHYGKRVVRVEYKREGNSLSEEFPLDGLGSDQNFLSLLSEGNIETIHSREASLEDIFIQVTGTKLSA